MPGFSAGRLSGNLCRMAILVLKHSPHSGIERLGETLSDFGQRLQTVQLHEGEPLPADLDGIDGIVSCGGAPSAMDDSLEWLAGEMDLIRAAHEYELPVIGLCLGGQILSRALGGKVSQRDDGIQLGWTDVSLTPSGREDPLHAGIAWTSPQFHWNRDRIAEAPAGARVLASSQRNAVEAWVLGLRTYAFQYHPEIFRQTIDVWINDDPYGLEEANISRDELLSQTEKKFPTMQRLTSRLFHSMALLLMPVDRRYKGIAKELHH